MTTVTGTMTTKTTMAPKTMKTKMAKTINSNGVYDDDDDDDDDDDYHDDQNNNSSEDHDDDNDICYENHVDENDNQKDENENDNKNGMMSLTGSLKKSRRSGDLPSRDMPTWMHFFKRQYWQLFLVNGVISHFSSLAHFWFIPCVMHLRKNPCIWGKLGVGVERRKE